MAAGLSTLLFNANALMRFDGYFILADLIEVPNLYSEGTSAVQRAARRIIVGESAADGSLDGREKALCPGVRHCGAPVACDDLRLLGDRGVDAPGGSRSRSGSCGSRSVDGSSDPQTVVVSVGPAFPRPQRLLADRGDRHFDAGGSRSFRVLLPLALFRPFNCLGPVRSRIRGPQPCQRIRCGDSCS